MSRSSKRRADGETATLESYIHSPGAICPLPQDVVAQIKSSSSITSLGGVVLELLKNALDGDATKVEVSVDFSKGACVVEDNGLGIEPREFADSGGLLKLYYTSKYNSEKETYGHHGTSLASIGALSLLSITSHHHLYRPHNTLTVHRSKLVARLVPAPAQHELAFREHGTRVSVSDLFGNFPVRVKQRAALAEEKTEQDKLWDELKRDIVALLIAWQRPVAVRMRDSAKGRSITLNSTRVALPTPSALDGEKKQFDLSVATTLLAQASYIELSDLSTFVPLAGSTSSVSIRGAISTLPVPTKRTQFISLGINPLYAKSARNEIYAEINRIFSLSTFGVDADLSEIDEEEKDRRQRDKRYKIEGFTNEQARARRKGVDRYPMFCFSINWKDNQERQKDPQDIFDTEANLRTVIEVLNAMITEWLSVHHFQPRKRGRLSPRKNNSVPPSDARTHERSELRNELGASSGMPTAEQDLTSATGTDGLGLKSQPGISASNHDSTEQVPHDQKRFGDFSGWSRIKSGDPKFPEQVSLPTKVLEKSGDVLDSSKDDILVDDENGDPQVPSTAMLEEDDRNQQREISQSAESGEDETTTWMDPKTGKPYVINTRTGCTVPDLASRVYPVRTTFTKAIHGRNSAAAGTESNSAGQSGHAKCQLPGFLKDWQIPIFERAEKGIPQLSFYQLATDASKSPLDNRRGLFTRELKGIFTGASISRLSRISKEALGNAQVIAQVDKKFILVRMDVEEERPKAQTTSADRRGILVLIDQHAADERCRVEGLLKQLCRPASQQQSAYRSQLGLTSRIATTALEKPIAFELSAQEADLSRKHASHFADWGILYDIAPSKDRTASPAALTSSQRRDSTLSVTALPSVIVERCKMDNNLLFSLIRSELWKSPENPTRTKPSASSKGAGEDLWLSDLSDCPAALVDMINSRACRSAIMFHDILVRRQCEDLVSDLAKCAFPFQCAHGRPSMVPLVDLGPVDQVDLKPSLNNDDRSSREVIGASTFKDAYKAWKKSP